MNWVLSDNQTACLRAIPSLNRTMWTLKKLGQWLSEHSISRAEIAKALGVQTTVVHNWFARQRIPKNVQGSLRHLMSKDYPSELESQIAVRMKNSTLNEVVKRAVKEGLSVEEWILRAVEERLGGSKSLQ